MLESIAKQETLAKDQNHSKQVKALNEKWKKETKTLCCTILYRKNGWINLKSL